MISITCESGRGYHSLKMLYSKMLYVTLPKMALVAFQLFVETVYLPVRLVRIFKKHKKCPPILDEILLLRASQLAERIRKKQISSVSVIQAYINRINEVNPIINAVIANRFEAALREAAEADNLVRSSTLTEEEISKRYPLLGVPITIKGSIAVEGLRHTAGRVDIDRTADEDAVTVKHAKKAGAIPLLISNVPELCLNWETSNKLTGYTFNPYNTSRTSAGSSGGEASLMGCGASLIGIGSDVAGSLRLPAHCCGVWGHKPSPHVVSCVGHYPDCKNRDEWDKVFTLGPIARYASDLKLLLKLITEPCMKDALKLDEIVDVKKINVYYMTDVRSVLISKVTRDVREAVRNVVAHFDILCDNGCTEVNINLMKYCAELSFLRLLNVNQVENVFNDVGDGSYAEMRKFLKRKSNHEFTTICYGILRKNVGRVSTKHMKRIYLLIDKLRDKFIDILGHDGVFILPTSPSEAYYRGDVIRKLFDAGYLSIFNALGFPVTNCPITFSKNGLPIGIQVVAAPNMDRLTLAVAEEIEKTFGGWKFE